MITDIKALKGLISLYKEGQDLIKKQNTDITDYDDQLIIESKDISWSFPIVARALKLKQNKVIIMLPQKKSLFTGATGSYFNREYCDKENITVTPFPIEGGAIITDKGDLMVLAVHKSIKNKISPFVDHIKTGLIKLLKDKGLDVSASSNDILVDGAKIAGTSVRNMFGFTIEAVGIFVNNHQKVLENIGHRKPRKVSGLSDFGLKSGELVDWIKKESEVFYGNL